ncbi:MAG: 2,4-dihydroxyhept-2-ene-1,7-dioic acid aldolase [Lentisphaeria bacterium]|nr:aldolase/citrate lyase family protein [Lentisphaeria bacterium]NQZ68844.1 2,4-dihydroxyhept-2-ene-1,7-dioic acid aldolase [Lentisphaeria bacterium]
MIKERIENNELTVGTWQQIASPEISGILASQNFDWICLDAEHGVFELSDIRDCCQAIQNKGNACFVRLPACDPIWVRRSLDAGIDGLIIPMVHSEEIARTAVKYAKYPPLGERGYGFSLANTFGLSFDDYAAQANDRIPLIAQIEHIDAVNNIDSILAVDGIDGVIIGPYDLSGSMGIVGQMDHPKLKDACDTVLKQCLAAGKVSGIHCVSEDKSYLNEAIEKGYRFIAYGMDTVFLSDKRN